jgi:5-hydroxyisourate hydrolase
VDSKTVISLSSHVLDTTTGSPAAGIPIELSCPDGRRVLSKTDADGRCSDWQDVIFSAGTYQLRFYTKKYLSQQHNGGFYPFVDVHFDIEQDGGHYHVPLLISPYGFSSYRGS